MKDLTKLLLFNVIIAALLVGCGIGKTKTMFISKTNAGLELSAAPPTISLAISRYEGVIAPQFENGKKLPVLASFKFNTSRAFSPHAGSAFATGDAAVTLAALYSDDVPYPDWGTRAKQVKREDYPGSSVLELQSKPNPGSNLQYQEKETKNSIDTTDVRPVFFGTDTALGVKVAWSGMSGGFPDSAVFGYNRKEFALVPISMEEKNVNSKKTYNMRMASLLATIDTGAKIDVSPVESGSPDTPVSPDTTSTPKTPGLDAMHIQYFATGNAATLLALQSDVRKAMLARLDPNKEAYEKEFGQEQNTILSRALVGVYDSLKKLGSGTYGKPDLIAKEHKNRLDKIVGSFDIPQNFQEKKLILYSYIVSDSSRVIEIKTTHGNFNPSNDKFLGLVQYWSSLQKNIDRMKLVKKDIDDKITPVPVISENNTTRPLAEPDKQLINTQIELQKALFNELDQKVRTNSDVIRAYQYFASLIQPK